MARKKLKDFTTLELTLSVLLLTVFLITIPLLVLSAKDSLESQGNRDSGVLPAYIAVSPISFTPTASRSVL